MLREWDISWVSSFMNFNDSNTDGSLTVADSELVVAHENKFLGIFHGKFPYFVIKYV